MASPRVNTPECSTSFDRRRDYYPTQETMCVDLFTNINSTDIYTTDITIPAAVPPISGGGSDVGIVAYRSGHATST